MYFVKLRHAEYDAGKVFNMATYDLASKFAETAITHGRRIDGNPLVAELWEDDTDNDTRKPNDEEEQP